MKTHRIGAEGVHRFAVGEMVRLNWPMPLRNAVEGPYEVLEQRPARDRALQYRIQSDREPYQRIVKEDELDLA
jgi:hypothetical protein